MTTTEENTTVLATNDSDTEDTPEDTMSDAMKANMATVLASLKAAGMDGATIQSMDIAKMLENGLEDTEERWDKIQASIAKALPKLVGTFDGFQTIELSVHDGTWTVTRHTEQVKSNGRGNGGGTGALKCHITPEFQQKYGLRGDYRSVRGLSHALAILQKKDTPPDNGTGKYIRANAPDLAKALLADGIPLS